MKRGKCTLTGVVRPYRNEKVFICSRVKVEKRKDFLWRNHVRQILFR